MRPASPESIEDLFHYHCDTLKLLQGNPDVAKPPLLDDCIDRCKQRIDDVLDLYKNLGYMAINDKEPPL
jgi:hypothetical protein